MVQCLYKYTIAASQDHRMDVKVKNLQSSLIFTGPAHLMEGRKRAMWKQGSSVSTRSTLASSNTGSAAAAFLWSCSGHSSALWIDFNLLMCRHHSVKTLACLRVCS